MSTQNRKIKPKLTKEVIDARRHLAVNGWQQVDAAAALGVTPVHLNYVLRDRRPSARLLVAILDLGASPNPTW
jgi:hypothetical protein